MHARGEYVKVVKGNIQNAISRHLVLRAATLSRETIMLRSSAWFECRCGLEHQLEGNIFFLLVASWLFVIIIGVVIIVLLGSAILLSVLGLNLLGDGLRNYRSHAY